jgi:cell division ATPase FtsA
MFKDAEELRIKYGIITKANRELFDDGRASISSSADKKGPGQGDAQSDQNRSGGNWVNSEKPAGAFSSPGVSSVSRQEVSDILLTKTGEIMRDVYKKIEPFLKQKKKLPRIYAVGGVSKMDGFVETVEDIFKVPVNMGRIRDSKDFHDMNFAQAFGLMRYGICKMAEKKCKNIFNVNNFAGRVLSRIQSIFSEYF